MTPSTTPLPLRTYLTPTPLLPRTYLPTTLLLPRTNQHTTQHLPRTNVLLLLFIILSVLLLLFRCLAQQLKLQRHSTVTAAGALQPPTMSLRVKFGVLVLEFFHNKVPENLDPPQKSSIHSQAPEKDISTFQAWWVISGGLQGQAREVSP